ncbi:MAG TPA: 50S ribosomal protein L17 [Candidatus Paceibacterota bacterium]|nr:50S ribosomal protein L17 [Candidatus Paceibacterota bacterium]
MRHHNSNRKFGRTTNQRHALLRELAKALLTHGRITTTEARAKEIRPAVEKMVTRAIDATPADKRVLAARLGNSTRLAKKLVDEIAPKYKTRKGGYTRITKLGARSAGGDASQMAVIEFV